MLREQYIQEVVWGVNFCTFLSEDNFKNYIKFIKTFYNEDIQSSLHAFDITQIFMHLIHNMDLPNCCVSHSGKSTPSGTKQKQYPGILMGVFEIVENILTIKRTESDLSQHIK
jgi:hypothetical protein